MREERNKQINRNSRLRQLITLSLILGGLFCVSLTGCVQKSDTGGNLFEGQFAPLLEGMGDHHFEISTDDTLVQRYFNQGMILTYGFNHAEIVFREDL